MTWAPTNQVIDPRPLVDNLLGYIGDNQTDAHAWANDGKPMPDYKKLYPNASGRLATLFPQLIVLDKSLGSEDGESEQGDVWIVPLVITLECAITGPNADRLVDDAEKYEMALNSMLANIPSQTLTAGSMNPTDAIFIGSPALFDQVAGYEKKASAWMQIFKVRCEYRLITAKQ